MDIIEPDLRFDLEIPANGYKKECALFTARLSQMAYAAEKYDGCLFSDGSIHAFNYGAARGIVFDNGHFRIIAFAGSQTWGDWRSNFDIRKVMTDVGDIHRGFFNSLATIRETHVAAQFGAHSFIIQKISEIVMFPFFAGLVEAKTPIIFTGHSRGGALAIIGAALFYHRYRGVHSVYAFSMPKVGGKHHTMWWQEKKIPLFLIVLGRDIVPNFPPNSLAHAFKLAGFLFLGVVLSKMRKIKDVSRRLFTRPTHPGTGADS
jgi:hypothetical protein